MVKSDGYSADCLNLPSEQLPDRLGMLDAIVTRSNRVEQALETFVGQEKIIASGAVSRNTTIFVFYASRSILCHQIRFIIVNISLELVH